YSGGGVAAWAPSALSAKAAAPTRRASRAWTGDIAIPQRYGRGPVSGPTPFRRSSLYLPAALRTARTRAGVIGASRMRRPVASKNALAIDAGIGAAGGSPEPVGTRSVRCTIS